MVHNSVNRKWILDKEENKQVTTQGQTKVQVDSDI